MTNPKILRGPEGVNLNWRVILIVSSAGLVMGVLSLYDVTGGSTSLYWLALGLLSALWIARRAAKRYFWNGFAAGALAAILNALVQVLFYPTYAAHHTALFESAAAPTPVAVQRLVLLMVTPVAALISGSIIGLLSLAAGKFVQRKQRVKAPHDTPELFL
jgi:hypothetical protein